MLSSGLRRLTSRLSLAIGLALAVPSGFGQVTTEAQLKAAYLVNFMKYIEWPAQRSSANICLFGRDSLGPYLAAYEGRQVSGLELRILKFNSPEQLSECHMLFVPETEEARFGAVLRWTERQPILTVSDAEVFVRQGGAVALVRTEGRLQFDINVEAMGRANLKPGSQLLRLARQVIGGSR